MCDSVNSPVNADYPLGPLDEAEVVTAFLDDLACVSETRRLMSLAWRSAGVVYVERRAPEVTGIGKVLHFRARPRSGG